MTNNDTDSNPEIDESEQKRSVSTGADVSVDLSDGEQQDTPRQKTDSGIPKEQIEQEGRKQAKQTLSDARGDTREQKLTNAIDDLEDTRQELASELQYRRQQASQLETKRSGLELTIERLEAGADEPERTYTRELEGGITEEIRPDERQEFADRYSERREQLGETKDEIESRCDALSHALERTEYARQELIDMQDLLGSTAPESGSPSDSASGPQPVQGRESRHDVDVTDDEIADILGW